MTQGASLSIGAELFYAMGGANHGSGNRWIQWVSSAFNSCDFHFLDTSDEYRRRKENFVTGHNGSSMLEVASGLAAVPVGVLLLKTTLSCCTLAGYPPSRWPLLGRFMLEFAIVVLPAVLSLTILADYCWHLVLGMLGIAVLQHYVASATYGKPILSLSVLDERALQSLATEKQKTFISHFRSGMMLSTWIAILAVDFPVFPRRFAKTETFGTSIMDIGVGAFILASAIVSRQTRRVRQPELSDNKCRAVCPRSKDDSSQDESVSDNDPSSEVAKHSSSRVGARRRRVLKSEALVSGTSEARSAVPAGLGDDAPGPRKPHHTRATSALKPWSSLLQDIVCSVTSTTMAVSPLLVLGFGRLFVHTALNYQTHVSEYGVHWNFSFTSSLVAVLAAVLEVSWRVGVAIVQQCTGRSFRATRSFVASAYVLLGFACALGYQIFLASPVPDGALTVQQYILAAPREGSFIAQNREGLAGICGFFAVYLIGVGIGRFMLAPNRSARSWQTVVVGMCVVCGFVWAVVASVENVIGPVSRRLVNLPYVLWVVAYCITMLLCLLLVEVCTISYDDGVTLHAQDPLKCLGNSYIVQLFRKLFVRESSFTPKCIGSGSIILDSINVNLLALFVLSNLLVGIPNHTMYTLDTPDSTALAILSLYMLVLCTASVACKKLGLHFKVW